MIVLFASEQNARGLPFYEGKAIEKMLSYADDLCKYLGKRQAYKDFYVRNFN